QARCPFFRRRARPGFECSLRLLQDIVDIGAGVHAHLAHDFREFGRIDDVLEHRNLTSPSLGGEPPKAAGVAYAAIRLMRLIQHSSALGAGKNLLHWADCVRIHHNHPRLAQFDSSRKSDAKFPGRSHPLRLETERASNRNKIGTPEIHTDSSSLEMRVLNIAK